MTESEPSAPSSQELNETADSTPPSSQVSMKEESNASSFGVEYDRDLTSDTLKRSLEDCLNNVKAAGSFATSGVLTEATLSGLSVHNVGSIGLPLQEGQAKAIIDVCHRAPFGQGNRTVIDESVRKTWQLNPDQFELRNPKWPSVVQKVTEQVAQDLGCVEATSVDAQLYKMLLYEEGAMFKPHKDTEKAPGMFGTLVVCLPSEYGGGAVVASHRRESKVFETNSAFDHTYIAWYADVTHEVKTVTSGYRLVLIYNLIDLSQGSQRSAAMLSREKSMLKNIVSSWANSVQEPSSKATHFLAYKLDHEYTDASLKYQSLKGLDKVRAEYLREVCAETNACFYLASMERTVVGSCEEDYSGYSRWERNRTQEIHTLEEVVEESTELKRMIDLDGSVLARELPIDETDIVQKDPFDRSPDTEDFEGYTGNEGASATQFYHDTVAVLVPRSSLAQFLSKHVQEGIVDTNPWYKRLLKKVQENPKDESWRQELHQLAVLINQAPPRPQTVQAQRRCLRKNYFPAPEAQWPLEASILLEDQALFEMAIESTKSLSVSIAKCIGKAMFLFDLPTTHAQINHLISRVSSFHGQCRAFVSIVASYEALKNRKAQRDDAQLRLIKAWAEKTYMDRLHNVDALDREDGLCLAELAIKHTDRKSLSEFLHLAKPRAECTAFFVAFVARLLFGTDTPWIGSVHDTFDFILEMYSDFLPRFSVECRSVAKRGRFESDMPLSPVQCLLSAEDVAILFVLLNKSNTEVEALKLVRKLETESSIVDVVAFESFLLLLLKALIAMIPWRPEQVIRYQKLFQTTLLMYAMRFVQIEPQLGNWTNKPQGCGSPRCSDCSQLDHFLVNASQQSMRFPVSKKRRQHLHQMLEGTTITHVTDRRAGDTLVVTKLASPSMAKHEQWQKRFSKAEEQIKKLDQKVLKQLLDDDYEYLTELRDTRRGREGLPSARVAPRRQGPEIIDLTA